MIFSRLRRAKILHCIREYLSDNFHFSGNYHSKPRTDTPFKLFHSPAFAPPAELKQASKMLGWEIPSPLEENPTHTYDGDTQLLNVNDFLPSRFTWKMALLIYPSLFPSQNYMGLWEMLCDLGSCTTSHMETGNWEAFRPPDIKVVYEAEMKCSVWT